MKLYTKTGDQGKTSLSDGTRVPKNHVRIVACGDVDELIASLGWCRCAQEPTVIISGLETIQKELILIAAELARPAGRIEPVKAADCQRLETWIDQASAIVGPIKTFVLPGGTELSARLHLARACCRRAERSVVALAAAETLRPDLLVYLNRLSDLLFVWARQANHDRGVPEIIFTPAK